MISSPPLGHRLPELGQHPAQGVFGGGEPVADVANLALGKVDQSGNLQIVFNLKNVLMENLLLNMLVVQIQLIWMQKILVPTLV